jgi:hypothetical protein
VKMPINTIYFFFIPFILTRILFELKDAVI